MTLKTCEILKISRSGYEKLKKLQKCDASCNTKEKCTLQTRDTLMFYILVCNWFHVIADKWEMTSNTILKYFVQINQKETLKLVILSDKSELRHHNIILHSIKNKYSFWDLLKITFYRDDLFNSNISYYYNNLILILTIYK